MAPGTLTRAQHDSSSPCLRLQARHLWGVKLEALRLLQLLVK